MYGINDDLTIEWNKCRICFENTESCCSIYNTVNEVTFVDMIRSIADIKVTKDEYLNDIICLSCQTRLKDSYDFKILLQRSVDTLQHNLQKKLNRINFNDIDDIKIKIKFLGTQSKPEINDDVKKKLFIEENTFTYNDTVIKKLNGYVLRNNSDTGTMSVLDFLDSIKDENDGSDFGSDLDNCDPKSDEDYDPTFELLKQRKYHKYYKAKRKKLRVKKASSTKEDKKYKKEANIVKVCIKPVYLNNIRIIPTKKTKLLTTQNTYRMYAKNEICPYCGKMSKSLNRHILIHTGERKYKCDQCTKAFFKPHFLDQHKRTHSPTRDHKCDQCVATFKNKLSLQSHIRVHNDVRKYVCEVCSKGFKRSNALARHVLIHNSASKCIKCELCKMSFISKYGLQHHMRVHTGERPYKCELCSQPYSYKHDFNRHCFKKHGIFLKGRSVYRMNEEVLERERALMRDLKLRANGVIREGEPLNPFQGPQAAKAFELAMKVMTASTAPTFDS